MCANRRSIIKSGLVRTDKTVVLQHEAIQAERFTSVAETCAGFGGVSQGYEKCGCEVEEVNEANPRFCRLAEEARKNSCGR